MLERAVILAFDDTDSTRGGCTTYAAFDLVRRLEGIDLIGRPRLVRLNPNVPHKTRGNGAVALVLGHGRGPPVVIGDDDGRPLHAYPRSDPLTAPEAASVFQTAQRWITKNAWLDDLRTHPGLVSFERPPSESLYRHAVHRYVGIAEAQTVLSDAGATFTGWKSGRGIVGATAAAAWPAREGTFEWIAYREESRLGTPRDIDRAIGPEISAHHPSTFDNHDPETGHLRITPASPCPILGGVRGTDATDVGGAAKRLGPERPAGGLIFATNQATDDHAQPLAAEALRPFMAASVEAMVARRAADWPGGHVFLRLQSGGVDVDAAAFEPTGGLRAIVRDLRPGDEVRLVGGTHDDPRLLAMEKLEILRSEAKVSRRAPDCPTCSRRMESRGRGAPHRCPSCGRTDVPARFELERPTLSGSYEVPVRVRRHLSRPLSLKALATDVAAV